MISRGELKEIFFKKDGTDHRQYPFSLPFFNKTLSLEIHPKITYFVGENGTGKSTLLEAIAVASGFNPEGGTINFNFSTRRSHSILHKHLGTSRGTYRHTDGFFLRSESFFNVGTEIEKLDEDEPDMPKVIKPNKIIEAYGGVSLHEQSHGESFWALFLNRFRGNGFYVLDEPESALSPTRLMATLLRMHELILKKSQFVIATHSPILLAYPDALIYEFSNKGIKKVNYDQTDLVRSYKDFFKDPHYMVNSLLRETESQ